MDISQAAKWLLWEAMVRGRKLQEREGRNGISSSLKDESRKIVQAGRRVRPRPRAPRTPQPGSSSWLMSSNILRPEAPLLWLGTIPLSSLVHKQEPSRPGNLVLGSSRASCLPIARTPGRMQPPVNFSPSGLKARSLRGVDK